MALLYQTSNRLVHKNGTKFQRFIKGAGTTGPAPNGKVLRPRISQVKRTGSDIHKAIRKVGMGHPRKQPQKAKKRKKALSSDWAQRLAGELYKPVSRKFKKRRVTSNGMDSIWALDLVQMNKIKKAE